jgi:hypothetical protein
MPYVQIDLDKSLYEEKGDAISEAIHQGLIDGLDMDPTDLFQVFRPRNPGEIKFSRTYNGVNRDAPLSIHMLMVHMHPVAAKRKMFEEVVKNLKAIGITPDNVLIGIRENGFEDWFAGK